MGADAHLAHTSHRVDLTEAKTPRVSLPCPSARIEDANTAQLDLTVQGVRTIASLKTPAQRHNRTPL